MLVVKKRWGRNTRFTVLFKPGEFAPISVEQNRRKIFDDFSRWGIPLVNISGALGVAPDRIRGWKAREQYRIPQLYWLQLVHAHKAIFQHLLENEYIDIKGDVLPKWKVKSKKKETTEGADNE